jgi:hypothetical protein
MCAELVNDLQEYGEAVVDAGVGWVDPDTRELLIRARALLDQPVAANGHGNHRAALMARR